VPPRGRARTGKNYWKPSISEARDGFFLQIKIPGDTEKAKQEKIDFMFKRKFNSSTVYNNSRF